MSRQLRTPAEVRTLLANRGITLGEWARANGFDPNLTSQVLNGRRKGVRGQSHKIAVKLGIKAGELCPDPANALAV